MVNIIKRKRLLVILAAIFLLSAIGAFAGWQSTRDQRTVPQLQASADWVDHYASLEEITRDSDLIVRGTVTDAIPEKRADMIFTMQEIAIGEYIKGDPLPGDKVLILQTGGEMDGEITNAFAEIPLFQTKEEYLLFLKWTPKEHYLIMGGYQGAAKIADGKLALAPAAMELDTVTRSIDGKTLDEVRELVDGTMTEAARTAESEFTDPLVETLRWLKEARVQDMTCARMRGEEKLSFADLSAEKIGGIAYSLTQIEVEPLTGEGAQTDEDGWEINLALTDGTEIELAYSSGVLTCATHDTKYKAIG